MHSTDYESSRFAVNGGTRVSVDTRRFTLDGGDAIEGRIERDVKVVRDSVLEAVGADSLSALILGGGYGRGEGGTYVVGDEEKVYNDYDFFVVVPFTSRKRRKWVARQLEDVKAAVEPGCGIHVDFGPPIPEVELAHQPYELMYMELKAGHYVLFGPPGILDGLPDFDVSAPPLEEGARLFMNRGVGLLMAEMLLREGRTLNQDEYEFVIRNIYKAMMAMGDGILFVEQNYHPSYAVRRDRVASLAPLDQSWWAGMQTAYANALRFKFRPSHEIPDGQSLQEWYEQTLAMYLQVFLWFERQRLANSELDWAGYGSLQSRLPILSHGSHVKNFYRNIRTKNGIFSSLSEYFLHPRDRVLKRLPGLLLHQGSSPEEEALVLRLWRAFG